jgi:hypothetical protein
MEDLRQPREKGGLGLPSGHTRSLFAPFSLLFHFGKRKRSFLEEIVAGLKAKGMLG